jgi:GT2 family glycosyltransferase
MKIAVVILNWNGRKLLEQFLPSITRYSKEAILYVIDNASTDDSISFLQTVYPGIKIIQLDKNYGYAGGYNRGLAQIDADVYALVNSDLQVTENWLQPIIDEFETHKETAIIQPKIKDYKDKKMFEYAGAAGGYLDFFGYPYCDGRRLFKVEEDQGQYNRNKDIFWASGACLLIRKSVFDELKGFDECFFAHQEEIDMCWRAHHQKHRVKYIAGSTVYHLGGASLSNQNPFKTYLNFRNNLLMLLKNLPATHLIPVIFARLILDGVAGGVFLLQGKPKHTWAVVKAHFGFYKRIPKAWQKRPEKPVKKYYKRWSIFIK